MNPPMRDKVLRSPSLRLALCALSFFRTRRASGHRAAAHRYVQLARQSGWRGMVSQSLGGVVLAQWAIQPTPEPIAEQFHRLAVTHPALFAAACVGLVVWTATAIGSLYWWGRAMKAESRIRFLKATRFSSVDS
jgi:hypothetical protein